MPVYPTCPRDSNAVQDTPILSSGSISKICAGADSGSIPIPTLQILKAMPQDDGRWVVVLSDAAHHVHALLELGLELVLPARGKDAVGCIVQLRKWVLVETDLFPGAVLQVVDWVVLTDTTREQSQKFATVGEPTRIIPQTRKVKSAGFANVIAEGLSTPSGTAPTDCATELRESTLCFSPPPSTPIQLCTHSDRRRRSTTPQPEMMGKPLHENHKTVAISQLTPFLNGWSLKARVLSRTEIRRFVGRRGNGETFSCELMDRWKSQIRASFFGTNVDKFFSLLEAKGIILLSGAKVKAGDRRYTTDQLELTCDDNTTSVIAVEDDGTIPDIPYKFVQLASLSSLQVGSVVDVAGVVLDAGEAAKVNTKRNELVAKKDLKIVDMSGATCVLTLWGSQAGIEIIAGSIIFVRRARVGNFGGCSLSSTPQSSVALNPADPRAYLIQRWYSDEGGQHAHYTRLTSQSQRGTGPAKLLCDCVPTESDLLGLQSPSNTITHRVHSITVIEVYHDRPPFYLACPEPLRASEGRTSKCCHKKVEMVGHGHAYVCGVGHTSSAPLARYVLRVRIADGSGGITVTAFDNEAHVLLGMPAERLRELWLDRDTGVMSASRQIEQVFEAAKWRRFSVGLRSQRDEYSGTSRIKHVLVDCTSADQPVAARSMLSSVLGAV